MVTVQGAGRSVLKSIQYLSMWLHVHALYGCKQFFFFDLQDMTELAMLSSR